MGLIILYDVTMGASFKRIVEDYEFEIGRKLENHAEDFPIFLVGNKCDLKSEREVAFEDGLKVAAEYNWTFFEISSKSCEDVDGMFNQLVKKCLQNLEKNKITTLPPVTLPPQVPKPESQVGILKRGFLKVKNIFFGSKPDNDGEYNHFDASNIDTIDKPNRQHKNKQSRINSLSDEKEPEACVPTKDSIKPCIKPKEHEQSDNMMEPESCQNLSSHPPISEYFSGEISGEMGNLMPRPRVNSIQFPEPVSSTYIHTKTVDIVENPDASINELNSQSEVGPEPCGTIDVVEPESCILLTDKRLPIEDIDETEYSEGNHFI